MPPEVLGVAEVCELLKIQRMTLRRLRETGRFPEPLEELKAGPVWKMETVEAYRKKEER